MLDRKKLSSAYFTKNKIVQHQIDSFDEFIGHGLQKVVDEMGIIETEVGDASSGTKTYVRLETVSVGHPVVKEPLCGWICQILSESLHGIVL